MGNLGESGRSSTGGTITAPSAGFAAWLAEAATGSEAEQPAGSLTGNGLGLLASHGAGQPDACRNFGPGHWLRAGSRGTKPPTRVGYEPPTRRCVADIFAR